MVFVLNADMTTAQVQEVAAEIPEIREIPPVITTTPTIHGQDVPTMNTVQTAASIWVREQATVTPIPHGVGVLGTNTVMIAVRI